jgi:hypothetical protein
MELCFTFILTLQVGLHKDLLYNLKDESYLKCIDYTFIKYFITLINRYDILNKIYS